MKDILVFQIGLSELNKVSNVSQTSDIFRVLAVKISLLNTGKIISCIRSSTSFI